MISKILVANRGEIALRIIRTAREMGLRTVAVYSVVDKNSLHTMLAHESVCIGPAKASESYLNIPNIISAAQITKADAIHPGYGFLAENPRFPEICDSEDITFIGPPAPLISLMGDKNAARLEMKKAKLPVIPGSNDVIVELSEAKSIAKKIGYPVILKAVSGGGGRGMRIVRSPNHMDEQLSIAQYEAKASFGDSSLYMEKYITNARHIEIQVVGDTKGHVIALGERECSVQRKHQKVLEETPSPFVDEKLRKRIIKAAQDAAVSIGYQSLGTFEFLVDNEKRFYFHPVKKMLEEPIRFE